MNPALEWKVVLASVAAAVILVNSLIPQGERRRGIAFALAWLIPGAGHVWLGKWKKGVFFFTLLAATYLFGLAIVGFHPVAFDDNPFYYVGQYGSGLTFLLARLLGPEKAVIPPDLHSSWFDPGLLYVCVVGLLNLVLMLNVLDVKLALPAKAAPASPAPEAPAPPAPAPEKLA